MTDKIFKDTESVAKWFADSSNGGGHLNTPTQKILFAERIAHDHRTIQQNVVRILFGLIYALALELPKYGSDLRNEASISLLRKFKQLVDDGELDIGLPYV